MVNWGLGVGGGGGRGGGGHGAGVGDEERMIEEEAIKQTFYHLTSFILRGFFFLSTRPCISHIISAGPSLCVAVGSRHRSGGGLSREGLVGVKSF